MAERGEAVPEEHEAHGTAWLHVLLRAARDLSNMGLSFGKPSKAPCPFHDGVNTEIRAGRGFVCFVFGPVVHQMLFACVGLCLLRLLYVLSCLALLAEALTTDWLSHIHSVQEARLEGFRV